jgi:hypothetical protein
MASASAGRELAALLLHVVEETGLDLEDVAVTRVGHRAEVRVLVDKDGGVSLDDVAVVSLAISTVLDLPAADAILGSSSRTCSRSVRPVSTGHWSIRGSGGGRSGGWCGCGQPPAARSPDAS